MDYATIYPFWDKLTPGEQDDVRQACYTENYEKGMLMHRAEENCKGLTSVLSGQLRTYMLSDEGREVTLYRIYDGEICVLSASCLMDSIVFPVMIEATESTEVLVLPSVCLRRIMKDNPYVEAYLYRTATEKFSEVMWTMQQILFHRIDQRVAHFLLEEMQHQKKADLAITHEEIARYIGSAREVVTKVLRYFAGEQIVELSRGKIRILDEEKLRKCVSS